MARRHRMIKASPAAVWAVLADGTRYADWVVGTAASQPVSDPSGFLGRSSTSPRLREKARTRTSAWWGSGVGSGTSVSATCGAAEVVVRARTARA